MTLDKELHRSVLLELVAKTSWPGTFGKELGPLIEAIETATIKASADQFESTAPCVRLAESVSEGVTAP